METSIQHMLLSVSRFRDMVIIEWHRAVKEFNLRPGSEVEKVVGRITERLLVAMEQNTKVEFEFRGKVKLVEERFDKFYISGNGPDATFGQRSIGWYVALEDWPAALCFGRVKPHISAGDEIVMDFRKVEKTSA